MKKILLIQTRQLGDILLTTPCIRELKNCFPECSIGFLSHSMGKQILSHNPYLDEQYYYTDSDSLFAQISLANHIRKQNYDVVIDFMNNLRTGLYAWHSNAGKRVAFKSSRSIFYNKIIPRQERRSYIVDEKFELLKAVSCQPIDRSLTLPWFEQDYMAIKPFLDSLNADTNLKIILSPTHRREIRRWPIERYVSLAEYLQTKYSAKIIWIWGPGEEQTIDKILSGKAIGIKSPRTSIPQLCALMANCDLFIGNSNGPSHFAVSTDIPSIQIHGHTYGASWCPDNDRHRYIDIKKDRPDETIADEIQIRKISVSRVASEVDNLLKAIKNFQFKKAVSPVVKWQ